MSTAPLLEIRDLVTSFRSERGVLRAVDGISLEIERGRTLALVGESGCGKSVTALSIMRLLDEVGSIDGGSITLDGTNLLDLSAAQMRAVRGNRISMIFQEPMTAMNPVFTVGEQIAEVFRIHRSLSRGEANRAAVDILGKVGIPDAPRRAGEYPFQFSGGMLQRAMIAMAIACEPELLIADEPTTALDVTIQAQILDLMVALQRERGTSILLITHDLGVVAESAHDVAIMYAGRIAERGSVAEVFADPQHPYTRGLLASVPRLDSDRSQPLATIKGVVPSLGNMPAACRFNARCPRVEELCRQQTPPIEPVPTRNEGSRHEAACHLVAGRIGG